METRETVNHRQEGRGYGMDRWVTERWAGEWVEMDRQTGKEGVDKWIWWSLD